jgi:hypothetical protein
MVFEGAGARRGLPLEREAHGRFGRAYPPQG